MLALKKITKKEIFNINNFFMIITGSVIIAIFSKISIPMWPVPITGQTFSLLLIGVTMGPLKGFLAVINYIFLGIIGVPLFAELHGGISLLLGPTGGYIVGFPFTTLIIGYLYNNCSFKSFFKFFGAGIIALIPTFLIGLLWLSVYFGFNNNILKLGLYPFIIGEIIKILLVYSIAFSNSKINSNYL